MLGKKMRRWKAKSHTCSFHIPILNLNSYEVIYINDVTVICIERLESGRIRRRKRRKRSCVDLEMI